MVSSAGMNPCTDNVEPVVDKHGVKWWDTPGFETWTPEVASTFLHDNFYKRKILPKAAIFCRTANSLGDTRVVEYMFKEFQARGILVIFVITKYPFIGVDERADIEAEAFGLLGGNPVRYLMVWLRSAFPKSATWWCQFESGSYRAPWLSCAYLHA